MLLHKENDTKVLHFSSAHPSYMGPSIKNVGTFFKNFDTHPIHACRHFLLNVHAPLKPTVCKFFTVFFTAVYIVDRLVLQTIYVLN